ncbi:MAG: F0F1 ATP synthase subunit B [Nitrospirae bacterium]|nr:F0F1 ATP synthase subunit B [Nitrospirota bacterium]
MPQFDLHYLSTLVFWSIVSFGILLFVLRRFAFPVILRMLEEREKKIRNDLDQAERLKLEAQLLLAQYEAKLKSIHDQARTILEAASKQALLQLEENEQRMEQEAQRMLAEARSEIQRDQLQAVREVRRAAVDLTLLAAEKVLSRSLTGADHRRLIDEAVQETARQTEP